MKVLFCGLKYDYAKPEAGLSFENQNFYQSLEKMDGVEASAFWLDETMQAVGREEMNARLISTVNETKPDLLFCFLFTEELEKATIQHITQKTGTKTFNWFADDHWRFPVFSRHWAPLFTAVSTTDSQAVAKYNSIGVDVIKTQWGANTGLYKPIKQTANSRQLADITFVGKKYGNRESYINFLKNQQLPVEAYGGGWESGRVSDAQMLEIFSGSKINLNFTESYFNWPKQLAKLFFKKELGSYSFTGHQVVSNLESFFGALRPQIKGRIFEVAACGGFLITGDADNLRDYYIDGKEIVIFKNKDDLAEKCKYYLEHDLERQEISLAGYNRTLKEHTYQHRFMEIFKRMELK